MTAAAVDGTAGRRSVRAVASAPRRLRVVGGSERMRWWHGRLALGLTLAGAMVGALAGVGQGLLAGRWVPAEALESYGAGAGAGASAGLVVGLLVGLVMGLADRYVLPQVVAARPLWVQHRSRRALGAQPVSRSRAEPVASTSTHRAQRCTSRVTK